jgi:predicted Zn-dependent peptidase
MIFSRNEIMPGVALNCLTGDKFKTSLFTVSLLSQLTREDASSDAAVVSVLSRGSSSYPDMEKLSARMEELYGSGVNPTVRKTGEIHSVGFASYFPDAKYLPSGESVTGDVISLTCEMLLNPVTRGGLLLPDYVEQEKTVLLDRIRSRINDKRTYAVSRCIEEMCAFEDYGVSSIGEEKQAESIYYTKLTKHFRKLLSESPIEIFFVGSEDPDEIACRLSESLFTLPRGNINTDIGTDVRMNSVEEAPRYTEEVLDVGQGKLSIGFRLGECMEDRNVAAISLFNAIFGGTVTSKLFMNVREKLSLAYYASSFTDVAKGIMLVNSGIDSSNYEKARDEIFAQLEAVKRGDISDYEFSAARAGLSSSYRMVSDSPQSLEGFYFQRMLEGEDISPNDRIEDLMNVSKDDVVEVANSVVCDQIYFLKGTEGSDNE